MLSEIKRIAESFHIKFKPMNAAQLNDGKARTIDNITASPLYIRLMEMGILPGKNIQLFKKAPFNGPMAFVIDENIIALRIEEAELINLKP